MVRGTVCAWGEGSSCGQTRIGLDSDLFTNLNSVESMSPAINEEELVATLESHKVLASKNRESAGAGEANTIDYLVRPFIEDVLGFRFNSPTEIERESDVGAPGKNEKVDIALIVGGHRVVLVEVKRRGEELGHRNIAQLQNYFTWVRTARFAVLTDGIEWQWFKGKSGPGNENFMEDKPFLVHDALSPADKDIDWIWNVSKARFDAERLTGLSRQIEFTAKLRDWILGTLVSPDAKGARQLNELVGLGASSQETPLVVAAIRSAWDRVVGGQETAAPEESDIADELVNAPDTVQPTSTNSRSPACDPRVDASELEFVSHWDERMDLGDGRVLDANKMARAWRMGDRDWVERSNGTLVATAVLAELLRCDENHRDEKDIAAKFGLRYASEQPRDSRFRKIPGFSALYWNMNRNNHAKAKMLEEIASKVQFDPRPDSLLAKVSRIEWWLPAHHKP